MTPKRLLITGATGNAGIETLRALQQLPIRNEVEVLAGWRHPSEAKETITTLIDGVVRLDFADVTTFDPSLAGVDRVLLIRPPQLANVNKYFKPFVEAMKRAAVKQVVFLSLQGAEKNPVTPHYKIQRLIKEAGLPYTFLQPSFFMQNLSTIHRDEIRMRNEIFVPAGHGRTSFIDIRDIGAVTALALTDKTGAYVDQSIELTGSEALTYWEVAQILSDVLGRTITYRNPPILRFIWRKWVRERLPLGFVLIMAALYTIARLGKAGELTTTLEQLIKRAPISFRQFAQEYRSVWER